MGGSPGNVVAQRSQSPSGAAHLSSYAAGGKFDPTGKPRWRVLPSSSERKPKHLSVAPPGLGSLLYGLPSASALG